MSNVTILQGDSRSVLQTLPDESVQMCVTSPPYFGLRDYGVDGQIGLEPTPDAYVTQMVGVFREVRRVLKNDGTLWLNLGDSYARNGGGVESKAKTAHKMGVGQKAVYAAGGMQSIDKVPDGFKSKDLLGIPWRVAFALQEDGWYLRQDIIWHKPNPMPESVKDRCTKAHEYIFLLSKSERYYYDADAISEPLQTKPHAPGNKANVTLKEIRGANASKGMSGQYADPDRVWCRNGKRNRRSVWTVPTSRFSGAHFATFPPALIEPCILAGSRENDTVLDPFNGAGTTGVVSMQYNRHYIGVELNPAYVALTHKRLGVTSNE